MEPLDNPVWHALTGPQATVAEGKDLALRYDPEVAPFAAIPDQPAPEAWDTLRDLVGTGGTAALFRELEPPSGWEVVVRMSCNQMIQREPRPANGAGTALSIDDVPEIMELIAKTRPGPFFERTIELGRYVGIREDGKLVAMTGERMRFSGFTEVSAVCTDPDYRGRGLAAALIDTIAGGIRERGETPMLHVLTENTSAIALYEKLGFTTRRTTPVVVVRAP